MRLTKLYYSLVSLDKLKEFFAFELEIGQHVVGNAPAYTA